MIAGDDSVLDVRLTRRVHPSLTIDVEFRLGPECGVVFGPSGAGKSTLLRLIAGLTSPDSGRVRLGDETLFDSTARIRQPLRTRRIGMVFQDDSLFPHLKVGPNILYGLKGWGRVDAEARKREVAALCAVEHLLDRSPTTLSGGERQRVGLARALAPRPRLLLCDEPVSALDLANRHQLLDRLRAVQVSEAIPILYVTHSPSEAIVLGRTLFRLESGRITAQGVPLDVLAATARLDGIRNVFPAEVDCRRDDSGETRLRLVDGPTLLVPFTDLPEGRRVTVEVRAEEVLLAREPVGGLSARNVIPGVVDRVVSHGDEAEVVIRTGGVAWVVSVVGTAVESLGLCAGTTVRMIIKARSCRVSGWDN